MANYLLRGAAFAFLLCLILAGEDRVRAATLKPWPRGGTPVLALKDLQGHLRSLVEFRGQVVIVNFWATWCEPCVEEMPSLQKFKDRHTDKTVAIIGVNLGEGEARIRAFTDRTGTSFPILLDRDGVAKKNWKVNGVPTTFVLDTTGRIRYSYSGVLDFSEEEFTKQVERLLPQNIVKK